MLRVTKRKLLTLATRTLIVMSEVGTRCDPSKLAGVIRISAFSDACIGRENTVINIEARVARKIQCVTFFAFKYSFLRLIQFSEMVNNLSDATHNRE